MFLRCCIWKMSLIGLDGRVRISVDHGPTVKIKNFTMFVHTHIYTNGDDVAFLVISFIRKRELAKCWN